MYNIVLWGMGEGYDLFTACRGHSMVNVVAVADTHNIGYGRIDGIPIIKPEEICNEEYDYLVIACFDKKIFDEVLGQAVGLGISREVIIPVRVFEIPFFNFDDYIKIKKSNISFLSDYCFAAYLYYRFGLKRTSPTINMYAASNESYLNFLKDIRGHLEKKMERVQDTVENAYKEIFSYPRGKVGDSEWLFNHDNTYEEAEERWNKGVERFNYSNYYVFMTIRSDEAAYEFDKLPIEHKLGFYWKDLELKSVVCIPEWSDPIVRSKYGYDFAGIVNRIADGRAGTARLRNINWMKLLQFDDDFIRKN